MKITDPPIVIEHHFQTSKEKLWHAITEQGQMVQWFFDNIEAFEPVVGFKTHFVVKNEGRIFPHLWKITEVEPYKKITYNWKYEGYPGDSDLTFELIKQKNGTKLRLTHQILESFPQNIPEFKRESCLGGWHYFIKQRLHDYLSNTK
ncbi:SRPBCC domain-containing protein [Ascidiimonas aurantiaca]|uniref:SRPBCC family protein n=1 Tax=Ascidiimonas aurantiaca TaxID=1685432 RepID=UPI0030EBB880